MRNFLLLLGFSFLIINSYGQPAGLTDEIWYLRYIMIDGEEHFVPLGENLNLSFFEDNGTLIAEANGVENEFSAEATFISSTLTFTNQAITLQECLSPNCPYEDLYFYDLLTTINLDDKTFIYTYNEYSQGLKDLRIRDDNFITAYFTNQPIEPDPLIFQTWYLYEVGVDLGGSQILYGPDVPRITIAPDFTFTGVNGAVNFDGNFIYGENFVVDFKLVLENLSDPNTGIPDLIDFLPLSCYVETENFLIESFPGFYSAFRNTITLGSPQFNKQTVIIYPNPVQDKLVLKSSINDFDSVSIIDFNGRLIMTVSTTNLNEIDVSNLNAGIYFLKIESSNGISVKKFIKE